MPKKFAFDLGLHAVNHQLICWLSDTNTDKKTILNQPVDDDILQHILPHEKLAMALELLFIEGIKTNMTDDSLSAFKQVLQIYPKLDSANIRLVANDYYCAAVWLEHHGTKSDQLEPLLTHWREKWQQYKQRVNGNIPQWMLEYATRMDVKWP